MSGDRGPAPLIGLDYPCGRAVDTAAGLGLCAFHTELAGGTPSRKNHDLPQAERRPGIAAKPGAPLCACGEPAYARAMCYACYHRQYRRTRREQGCTIVRTPEAKADRASQRRRGQL